MRNFERMVSAGVTVGVPAALHYCVEHQVKVPPWLARAALHLLCDLLKRETSTKRGRSAGAIARYRQDMVDMIRWNEVVVLAERQAYIRDCFQSDPTFPKGRSSDELERAEWLGQSKSRVFECVADVLERTDAFGSPGSIKRSYFQVERQMKDSSKAWRYYQLDHLFLQSLGLESDLGYGHGAKLVPWRKHKPRPKRPAACAP
jgi:hypothetical protein